MFNRFRNGSRPRNTGLGKSGDGDASTARSEVGHSSRVREAEILAAVDQVPALPVVVNRILALVGDSHVSASDLEALICQDMVIAGKLLNLVNSPFYGLSNRIASISQAVTMIGLSSLRSLVLAVSTSHILNVHLDAYGYTGQGLWLNSMATGCLTREVAKAAGEVGEVADEFFVAGLLRDVGMLVLGPILDREGLRLRHDPAGQDLLVHERSLIGFDHCWVGQRVAEKWNLPDNLHYVIGKHHRIPQHTDAHVLRLLASVRIAERLAWNTRLGLIDDHPFATAIDKVVIEAAGLDIPRFKTLVANVPEIVSTVESGEI